MQFVTRRAPGRRPLTLAEAVDQCEARVARHLDGERHRGALVAGGVLCRAHHEGGADREGRLLGDILGPGCAVAADERAAGHHDGLFGGEVVGSGQLGEGDRGAAVAGDGGAGHGVAGSAVSEVEGGRQDVWGWVMTAGKKETRELGVSSKGGARGAPRLASVSCAVAAEAARAARRGGQPAHSPARTAHRSRLRARRPRSRGRRCTRRSPGSRGRRRARHSSGCRHTRSRLRMGAGRAQGRRRAS
jgi:hypothetical protein